MVGEVKSQDTPDAIAFELKDLKDKESWVIVMPDKSSSNCNDNENE